jgi:hypothetical protein
MKNDVFSLYPTHRGIERSGSVSCGAAMHKTVFIVSKPALRSVTQTFSVKEMNFIQDIISIFSMLIFYLILIVTFVTKY